MNDAPAPEPSSAHAPGQTTDDGRGRIFPCEGCGADLVFNIGVQHLKCEHCGFEKLLELPPDAKIAEQDYEAMLERLAKWRAEGADDAQLTSAVRCESCGAEVVFTGTLTSTACPYCASPIQRENVHDCRQRVSVDGVLPFLIDRPVAAGNFKQWVESRWFAPNAFRKRGVAGDFHGVYLPYWTFDTLTFNRYSGQRGEHYYVTITVGKETRQELRIAWYPASGAFQRFFDDVLVLASTGVARDVALGLDPWPLAQCAPFNQQMLAGFLARTYDVPLEKGFAEARQRVDQALYADVVSRIGGNEQRVDGIDTQYTALTFKHLLLPLWLLSYRYRDQVYQVAINGATGAVRGQRPYSWVKITLAVLTAVATVAGLWWALSR